MRMMGYLVGVIHCQTIGSPTIGLHGYADDVSGYVRKKYRAHNTDGDQAQKEQACGEKDNKHLPAETQTETQQWQIVMLYPPSQLLIQPSLQPGNWPRRRLNSGLSQMTR